MFVVIYEDRSVVVEGKDVKAWNGVPKDKKILSVILTDGYKLRKSIYGYDYYVVAYEGVATCPSGIGNYGIYQVNNDVVAQQVIGVKQFIYTKKMAQKFAADLREKVNSIKEVDDAVVGTYLATLKSNAIKNVNSKLKEFLAKLDNVAATKITFGYTVESISLDTARQSKKFFISGVSKDENEYDEKIIKKAIYI